MKSKDIAKKEKKEPLFAKSFRLAKSNPNKAGLMVLFDAMFLASFFGLQILAKNFSQSMPVFTPPASAVIFIVFSLIYYYSIVLFVYSFFKYSILDFIKSLFEKTEFSFKRLGQFYLLNLIIAGIFFAVMILAIFLLASIKAQYQPYVFIFLATPYLLFLYVIINTSHSLFYQDNSVKNTIKKSFSITFTKITIYRETILTMVIYALVLWLLFLGSDWLIRLLASKNYSLYLSSYAHLKQASVIFFDLVFYFVILINRISFYAITKERK